MPTVTTKRKKTVIHQDGLIDSYASRPIQAPPQEIPEAGRHA